VKFVPALIALCSAAKKISKLAAGNGIGTDDLGSLTGAENTDGDEQKALDVLADQLICSALAPTGSFCLSL
jgi:fructose-1,6-bisphosphatase